MAQFRQFGDDIVTTGGDRGTIPAVFQWRSARNRRLTAAARPRDTSGVPLNFLSFRTELDPNDTARIRTAVNLGIGVGDARFREELEAAEQSSGLLRK